MGNILSKKFAGIVCRLPVSVLEAEGKNRGINTDDMNLL